MRKFIVLVFAISLTAVSVLGQEPATKAEKVERAPRVYSLALAGSGGYMGVELKEVSKENFAELGLSDVKGVAISRVIKDTAAEKAGLQKGDVVVRFNGEAVTSTRKFQRMIREVAPDHTATMTVIRNGGEIDIPVTMGERKGLSSFSTNFEFPDAPFPQMVPRMRVPVAPDAPASAPRPPRPPAAPLMERPTAPLPPMPPAPPTTDLPAPPEAPIFPRVPGLRVFPDGNAPEVFELRSFVSRRTIGISTSSLTKQLGDYFGVEDGEGVLISNVSKDSPAEKAGLRAGDIIVEIDGKAVRNTNELIKGIGSEKEGDVTLTIVRDRGRQTIIVTPETRRKSDFPAELPFRTRTIG